VRVLRLWLQNSPAPYVASDAGAGNEITMVATDHEYGARIGTEHLIELGHRRIACISGPLDWRRGLLRRDGWFRTLQKYGIPESPSIVGEWSAKGGSRPSPMTSKPPAAPASNSFSDESAIPKRRPSASASNRSWSGEHGEKDFTTEAQSKIAWVFESRSVGPP